LEEARIYQIVILQQSSTQKCCLLAVPEKTEKIQHAAIINKIWFGLKLAHIDAKRS
jgi:hypothetical protein